MFTRSRRIAAVLAMAFALGGLAPVVAADPVPEAPPPTPVHLPGDLGVSIHAEMLDEHRADPVDLSPGPGSTVDLRVADGGSVAQDAGTPGLPNGLFREVLGYLPYWSINDAGDVSAIDFDLVSTIAYFSVGARADGTLLRSGAGWAGWNSALMTSVTDTAHARGVKIVLTVTMMAWNGNYADMTALLTSGSRRARLVSEIVAQVKARNADGVNLDFEPVPNSLEAQYTSFVRELKAGLANGGARSYLTVATMAGAARWDTGYDLTGLTATGAADALMVMAYDFNWSGSARAGGVAPLSSPYVLDVREAMADHLAIVPSQKIIWGVPYYGRAWTTTSTSLNSTTCASAGGCTAATWAPTYTIARVGAAEHGRRWDPTAAVPWYYYRDAGRNAWVQAYYDDVQSLALKYDLVNVNELRGIGIWSLGMDAGRPELWQQIDRSFQGVWFTDIASSIFRADILWLGNAGITAGCAEERFCPTASVTREQMASFLVRALGLPGTTTDFFSDDEASIHEDNINRLAASGITSGCGPRQFCPGAGVTREQMASFLVRALRLPSTGTDFFTDDEGSVHEDAINRLAASGVTTGCAAGKFCPSTVVSREQMAAFLHRALSL